MAAVAPRLDERVMPAGTGARFGLVVVLALVTSAKMVLEVAYSVTGERITQCELAAGIDVFRSSPDQSTLLARLTQASAYTNCEARVAPPPTAWLPVGWPVLVLVVAVFAFYADRWWKTRRSRVSPLEEFDDPASGFVISAEVTRLKDQAGVRAEVVCVVDVTSETRSATVLGSTRHPVLCLHIGLVIQRLRNADDGADDPEFRAVLLHEFAHIRYGDVSAARGTMAVWRAFVLVALLPYLIIAGVLATHGTVPPGLNGINPVDARDILITLVLAALGYLARCDVLRNREIYADREAVRNGAVKRCWPPRATGAVSWRGRAARGFAGLWRNHPGWDLRAVSLDDPRALFVVQAAPVFLTGVAAALIDADFQYVDEVYFASNPWLVAPWQVQAAGALPAVLITLIVGVALWRLVAYGGNGGSAAATGPRMGVTGLRTGLWLGAGMVVGDLAAGQGTITQLVPARPEMLLLVLAAGVGFAVWTVQCAGVWPARSPGRIPRRVMTAGLAGGFLALSWWFTWWADAGSPYSTGISISPSGFLRYMKYFYGQSLAHPAILTVASWFEFVLGQLTLPPLDLLAVAAAWMIPLLAWVRRPGVSVDGLPSLRVPLSWAAGGTVATWVCVVWAQAYMHRTQPPRPPLHGLYELSYMWLVLGAQAGPAVVVAVAVGLRRGRFRLLAALIAAEATVLAGFAGVFVLVSADGCIRPLNTLETSCSWRPGLIEWGYSTLVDVTAVVAALAAFAVCVLALARPAARRDGGEPQAARPGSAVRSGRGKTPAVTGVAGVAALGVALAGIVMKFPQQSRYVSPANQVTASVGYEMGFPSATLAPPAPGTAALEVEYWSDLGGAALLSRLQSDAAKISPVLAADFARQHRYTVQDFQAIEPVCADIVAVSQESNAYFLLPDARARPWWSGFAQLAGTGGRGCGSAIALLARDHFSTAFWTALNRGLRQIGKAYVNTGFIAARIEALEAAGGITGYGNGIAGPPLNVLPPPAGTQRWSQNGNTGNPMDLAVAVAKLYPASDWSSEETWLSRHEFVSAAREGWTYADGTKAAVIINRFAAATDATSQIGSWDAHFRQESAPAPALTDPADGGMGVPIPASKQTPYVKTEMATHLGFYVIEVQVYARTPAPAIAKALLRQQYALLKAGGA